MERDTQKTFTLSKHTVLANAVFLFVCVCLTNISDLFSSAAIKTFDARLSINFCVVLSLDVTHWWTYVGVKYLIVDTTRVGLVLFITRSVGFPHSNWKPFEKAKQLWMQLLLLCYLLCKHRGVCPLLNEWASKQSGVSLSAWPTNCLCAGQGDRNGEPWEKMNRKILTSYLTWNKAMRLYRDHHSFYRSFFKNPLF